jgi:hypothetical protein
MSDAPPMPEWAPQEGPWCLKQWIPYKVPDPKVDVCLLPPDHEDDCRGIHGAWHNENISLPVGVLK